MQTIYNIYFFIVSISYSIEAIELSTDIIVERGLVVSQGRQGVSTKIKGLIEKITPSGTIVKKGDFLFRLDTSNMQLSHDKKAESLEIRAREIEEKKVSIQEKEALFELETRWLKAKVDHQKIQYDEKNRSLTPDELRLANIPIELSKLKLDGAQEEFKRQKKLIESGFASASSITSKQLRLNSLELQLLKDQQSLALLKEGASPEERLELKVKLKTAQDQMNRQKTEFDHDLKVLHSELKELEIEYDHEKIQLGVVAQNLEYTDTYAEKDGIWILKKYRDWWRGGLWRDMHLGKNVDEFQVLGDLVDTNLLNIEVMIHEVDRNKIRMDQRCIISFPALGGKKVGGVLSSISKIAKDKLDLSENGEEVELSRYGLFQVFIKPDRLLPDLKPGMSAVVSIPALAGLN